MTFDECRAAVVRSDLEDCLYLGFDPVEVLRGGPEDWGDLEEALDSYRVRESHDHLHPPGAAVGIFDYDGSYEFLFFPELFVGSTEELMLDEALTHPAKGAEEGWSSNPTRSSYEEGVRRVHEWIRSGDIYQVNLARKLWRDVEAFRPHRFFQHLWMRTEAPQSAFLLGEERAVMSASPELFIDVQGRRIVTQPIKGTRRRDRDPLRDSQLAFELGTSPKEIAELVMITDLERNDLGRICEFGSVHVPDLVKRESFSHVHHLLSTVEGELKEEMNAVSALRACFPGGSITGAPKIRAMEIIEELEPFRRGFYTGAMGYFGFDGSARFNITIRTCEWRSNRLTFFVGSGLTIDSDPESEFHETEHKARAMLEAYAAYESEREFVGGDDVVRFDPR